MSNVILKVNGYKDREVLHVSYGFDQPTDPEGQPAGIARGGKINVHVKSLNDGNTDFMEWVCDSYSAKDGTIEFLKMDGTNMKTLKFEHAYLVKYEEVYDGVDSNNQTEIFTISAKKVSINAVSHNNKWTLDG